MKPSHLQQTLMSFKIQPAQTAAHHFPAPLSPHWTAPPSPRIIVPSPRLIYPASPLARHQFDHHQSHGHQQRYGLPQSYGHQHSHGHHQAYSHHQPHSHHSSYAHQAVPPSPGLALPSPAHHRSFDLSFERLNNRTIRDLALAKTRRGIEPTYAPECVEEVDEWETSPRRSEQRDSGESRDSRGSPRKGILKRNTHWNSIRASEYHYLLQPAEPVRRVSFSDDDEVCELPAFNATKTPKVRYTVAEPSYKSPVEHRVVQRRPSLPSLSAIGSSLRRRSSTSSVWSSKSKSNRLSLKPEALVEGATDDDIPAPVFVS